MSDISNTADIIDVRDVIERFEELDATPFSDREEDEKQEFLDLEEFLGELRGYGGDHQWRGNRYPVTLIRDSYFKEYAQELANDLYGDQLDAMTGGHWPFTHATIDWDRAADDLRQDYTSVDYDGITYWYR